MSGLEERQAFAKLEALKDIRLMPKGLINKFSNGFSFNFEPHFGNQDFSQ